MRFKKDVFPLIDSFPNTHESKEENWSSVGDAIHAKIPMDDFGRVNGIIQTFSNGKLLEERQYDNGRVFGAAVFYDIYEKPMTVRIVNSDGNFAVFQFH